MSSSPQSSVLVTGANGFVGRALCPLLAEAGFHVRQAVRNSTAAADLQGDVAVVGDIGPETDWGDVVQDIDIIIHLAARVHVLHETETNPLLSFCQVNRDGTIHLAEQAAAAGVKRIVFASSIKVNGEGTAPGKPYSEQDEANLQSPYAISKWEAEQHLRELHRRGAIEAVIVRPPLVYGPHVGANFLRLIRLVDSGLPLPLGRTGNKRSLIAVRNLCDFLMHCALHPLAKGETFLISDGEDLSTTELVRCIGHHLGKTPILLPIPYSMVRGPSALLGRDALVNRLWGWLQIDMHKAETMMEWSPPVSVDDGVRMTVNWYRDNHDIRQTG